MFKTIVWATDGSDPADLAFPYVKSLATRDGAAVVVVHSEEVVVGRGGGYPLHVDEDEIKAKIQRQTEELNGAGVSATAKFSGGIVGGAAHAIAEAASEAGADLIVLGTRGHTRIGGLLLGSVTQRLLQIAPCPVFAVPAGAKAVGSEDVAAAEAAS